MKKKTIIIIAMAMGLVISINLSAQQNWKTGGNTDNGQDGIGNPGMNEIGSTQNTDVNFITQDTIRMTLTGQNPNPGRLGLNTTTPVSRLHVHDGTVVFDGIVGTNPNLGIGHRMMWIPDLGAFRAGFAFSNEWDTPNVGLHSFAVGEACIASGQASISMGDGCLADGHDAVAIGEGCIASGTASVSLGFNNDVDGFGSFAAGYDNLIELSTTGGSQQGCVYSFAIGGFNNVLDSCSGALGLQDSITSESSYVLGTYLTSNADFNTIIGNGIPESMQLVNNEANSLMVGYNSNVSTLFVGPSNGTLNSYGNVGIGNVTNPSEVLDIQMTMRARKMPDNSPDALITGVYVNDIAGDNQFNYLAFNDDDGQYLGGDAQWHDLPGADCDWSTTGNNVWAGVTGAGNCSPGNVGVGTNNPVAKLDVNNSTAPGFQNTVGVRSMSNNATINNGVNVRAVGGSISVAGVRGLAQADQAGTGQNPVEIFGVRGVAIGINTSTCFVDGYGVYGTVNNFEGGSCGIGWAGFFEGDVHATGTVTWASDENLKQNIQDISGAMNILNNIDCKTYEFRQEEYAALNLPSGQHCGVIAQQLEEVLPNLVSEIHHPALYDDDGNIISEAMEYKGVNYVELIPILIRATQEQQVIIEENESAFEAQLAEMAEQMNALMAVVNTCCDSDLRSMEIQNDIQIAPTKVDELNQNTPNPFMEMTNISYSLAQDALATVKIYNSQGQLIERLISENQSEVSTAYNGTPMEWQPVYTFIL